MGYSGVCWPMILGYSAFQARVQLNGKFAASSQSCKQAHKVSAGGEERYVLDAIIGEGQKSTQPLDAHAAHISHTCIHVAW